jgi:hypothetical protein
MHHAKHVLHAMLITTNSSCMRLLSEIRICSKLTERDSTSVRMYHIVYVIAMKGMNRLTAEHANEELSMPIASYTGLAPY